MVCAQKGYPLVVTMADSFSDRTAQTDAHARRQGGADAARPEGLRHVSERRSNSPRPMAGSSPVSSRPRPMPPSTRRRRRARSSTISPASRLDWFVTGYGTGGTVDRRRDACCAASGPETRIVLCEPANAQLDRQRQAAGARRRTARRPAAIPPSSRTRSRAGRRISFPTCCRKRSTRSSMTK